MTHAYFTSMMQNHLNPIGHVYITFAHVIHSVSQL